MQKVSSRCGDNKQDFKPQWGYDAELENNTPVIITFDSLGTDCRYDDIVTGLTAINQERE